MIQIYPSLHAGYKLRVAVTKIPYDDGVISRLVELLKLLSYIHLIDHLNSYYRGQFDRLRRLFGQVKATYTAIVSIISAFYVF